MLRDLTPNKISGMTGHADLLNIFGTIIMICGGSIKLITKTESMLTWIEE